MENPAAAIPAGIDLEARRRRERRVRLLTRWIPAGACAALAGLYLLCATVRGFDLRIGLEVVVANASLVALVATGATFIFSCGSFDLSLGSNLLVSALVGVLLGRASGRMEAVVLGCLGTAVLLSLLNSLLASFFNLPVFIMTIVMMNVYSAAATLMITSFGQNSAVILPAAMTAQPIFLRKTDHAPLVSHSIPARAAQRQCFCAIRRLVLRKVLFKRREICYNKSGL